jgi:hypothetical protein
MHLVRRRRHLRGSLPDQFHRRPGVGFNPLGHPDQRRLLVRRREPTLVVLPPRQIRLRVHALPEHTDRASHFAQLVATFDVWNDNIQSPAGKLSHDSRKASDRSCDTASDQQCENDAHAGCDGRGKQAEAGCRPHFGEHRRDRRLL